MSKMIIYGYVIYVCLSLTTIIILSVLLAKKKDKKENFKKCVCNSNQAGRAQNCQDIVTVNNLYTTGKLTEFSPLPPKKWSTTSPGDVDFPKSQGCSFSDEKNTGKWRSWDFTDFGN